MPEMPALVSTHGVDGMLTLEASFNPQLSRKVLVYVSETKAPPNERFAHRERMNSLFTDSSVLINEKHIPAWEEKFCARFLMFTNSPNALPLAESDRRVYVARCPSTPRPPEYYDQLYGLLKDQKFLAAVWKFFKSRDLAKYNPGARAPLTESKLEMAESNRTAEQQDAVTFMHTAPFDVIYAPDLYAILAPERSEGFEDKDRPRRIAAITQALMSAGAATAHRKLWHSEVIKVNGSRQVTKPQRVWILRNVDLWREATAARLKEGIEHTRALLDQHEWGLDKVLAAWSKDEGFETEKTRDF
jgi:hypothetical protein